MFAEMFKTISTVEARGKAAVEYFQNKMKPAPTKASPPAMPKVIFKAPPTPPPARGRSPPGHCPEARPAATPFPKVARPTRPSTPRSSCHSNPYSMGSYSSGPSSAAGEKDEGSWSKRVKVEEDACTEGSGWDAYDPGVKVEEDDKHWVKVEEPTHSKDEPTHSMDVDWEYEDGSMKSNGKVKDSWTASHREWNASHNSWDRKWKDGDNKWTTGSGQWKDGGNHWASKDESYDCGWKKSYAKKSYDDYDSEPSKSYHSYSTQAQTIVHDHIVMLIYVYKVI